MKKYDELHHLNAAATPGPWEAIRNNHYWVIDSDDHGQIGDLCSSKFIYDADGNQFPEDRCEKIARGNAALIIAMRNALPELLAKAEAHDALVAALKQADGAISEFFRYWHGGETRGSYDGKPERDMLLKAGYASRAALAKLGGRDE